MADIGNLTVRLALQDSNFQQGIQQVNRSIRQAQSEFKLANSVLKDNGKGVDGLKNKQTLLSKTIDAQRQIVSKYQEGYKKSEKALKDNIKKQDELKNKLKEAKSAYEESSKTIGKNAKQTKELKTKYDELNKQCASNNEKIRSNVRTMENWEIKINNAKSKLNELSSQMKKVDFELAKQNNSWINHGKKLETVGQGIQKTGKKMSSLGQTITSKASIPLASFAAVAIKTTASYSDSMSKLKAITNSSSEDMGKMSAQAKELGIKTRYSAKQAADSMVMLGQAGYRTTEIMNTMPAVLNLAQAGAIDLSQSTDVLVSSMSQFGIETKNARHVADVLSLGANKANLSVSEMSESLKYAGSMANTAGWSIEETAGAIGLMSNYGIKGSQAGTTLRGSISRLVKPSKDAAEKMDELGIKIFDTKGKMKSLPDIIDEIKKGTSKLTEEQKMNALVTIFGQEAIAGINALMNEGGDSIRKYSNELKNSNGSAEKAAKTMEDNIGGAFRSFKSAIEGASNAIGTALTPTVRKATENVTTLTRKFAALDPTVQKTIAKFGLFGITLGPTLLGMGHLVNTIGKGIEGLGKLSKKIGLAELAGKGFTAATGKATLSLGSAAIAAAPYIVALGAIAAGGYAIHKSLNEKVIPSMESFSKQADRDAKITDNAFNTMQNKVTAAAASNEESMGKISKDTAKAMDAYVALDKNVQKSLFNININSNKITEKTGKELLANVHKSSESVKKTIDEKYDASYSTLNNFLNKSNALRDKDKTKLLTKMQKQKKFEKDIVDKGEQRINQIVSNALKNRKKLTNDEEREIRTIRENNLNTLVQTISKNSQEQLILRGKLKNESTKLNAEEAADYVKKSIKVRDTAIKNADKTRDKVIEAARYRRYVVGDITQEEFDSVKSAAEHQHEVAVNSAKGQHTEVVMEAEKQAGEHADKVDWEKGEIKNKWQYMDEQVDKHAKNIGKSIKEQAKEYEKNTPPLKQFTKTINSEFNDAKEKVKTSSENMSSKIKEFTNNLGKADTPLKQFVTTTSANFNNTKEVVKNKMSEISSRLKVDWEEIKNSPSILDQFTNITSKNFNDTKKSVDEKMNDTKEAVSKKWQEVVENTRNIGANIYNSAAEVGTNIVEGIKSGINNLASEAYEAASNLAQNAIDAAKNKLGIHSPSRVMMELGQYTSQGLALGILEDKDKVKKASELVAQTIKDITEGKLSDIKVKTNTNDAEIKDRLARQLNWGANYKDEYQKYLNFIDKLNKEEVKKSKEYLKEDYENRVNHIENRLRVLKNENKIELQTEKARIDSEIAYYQKLQRTTKDKNAKNTYANKLVALRQYQKSVLNSTKSIQDKQIYELERSKNALKEYYDNGFKLLDKREKAVVKSLKVEENLFKDLMITYETAIKQLNIPTGDLIKDLENQEAIVVVQSKKVEDLRKRYEDLAYTFGVTSEETIKSREEFEKARVELEKMANTVDNAAKKIAGNINKFQKTIISALKEKYNEKFKVEEDALKKEVTNLDNWKKESLDRINNVYNNKIKAIENSSKAHTEALQAEIKAIDDAEKQLNRNDEDKKDLKKINDLKASIEFEHNDFNKEQLKKELEKVINDQNEKLRKRNIEDRKKQLNEEIENIQDSANREKELLQNQKQEELNQINKIYDLEKNTLTERINNIKKFYKDKTSEIALQAEAEKMIINKNQSDIINLLHSYSKEYLMAGQNLGERLVEGFKPKMREIKDMIDSINNEINTARDNAIAAQTTVQHITNSKNSNYKIEVQSRGKTFSDDLREAENIARKLAFIS